MTVPTKTELRKAIEECGGIVADVARHYNKSRQTVYRWIAKRGLTDELNSARTNMRAVAKDVVFQRMMNDDEDKAYQAATFVLTNLDKDGEALSLSPEVTAMLLRAGVSVQKVFKDFEALIPELLGEK